MNKAIERQLSSEWEHVQKSALADRIEEEQATKVGLVERLTTAKESLKELDRVSRASKPLNERIKETIGMQFSDNWFKLFQVDRALRNATQHKRNEPVTELSPLTALMLDRQKRDEANIANGKSISNAFGEVALSRANWVEEQGAMRINAAGELQPREIAMPIAADVKDQLNIRRDQRLDEIVAKVVNGDAWLIGIKQEMLSVMASSVAVHDFARSNSLDPLIAAERTVAPSSPAAEQEATNLVMTREALQPAIAIVARSEIIKEALAGFTPEEEAAILAGDVADTWSTADAADAHSINHPSLHEHVLQVISENVAASPAYSDGLLQGAPDLAEQIISVAGPVVDTQAEKVSTVEAKANTDDMKSVDQEARIDSAAGSSATQPTVGAVRDDFFARWGGTPAQSAITPQHAALGDADNNLLQSDDHRDRSTVSQGYGGNGVVLDQKAGEALLDALTKSARDEAYRVWAKRDSDTFKQISDPIAKGKALRVMADNIGDLGYRNALEENDAGVAREAYLAQLEVIREQRSKAVPVTSDMAPDDSGNTSRKTTGNSEEKGTTVSELGAPLPISSERGAPALSLTESDKQLQSTSQAEGLIERASTLSEKVEGSSTLEAHASEGPEGFVMGREKAMEVSEAENAEPGPGRYKSLVRSDLNVLNSSFGKEYDAVLREISKSSQDPAYKEALNNFEPMVAREIENRISDDEARHDLLDMTLPEPTANLDKFSYLSPRASEMGRMVIGAAAKDGIDEAYRQWVDLDLRNLSNTRSKTDITQIIVDIAANARDPIYGEKLHEIDPELFGKVTVLIGRQDEVDARYEGNEYPPRDDIELQRASNDPQKISSPNQTSDTSRVKNEDEKREVFDAVNSIEPILFSPERTQKNSRNSNEVDTAHEGSENSISKRGVASRLLEKALSYGRGKSGGGNTVEAPAVMTRTGYSVPDAIASRYSVRDGDFWRFGQTNTTEVADHKPAFRDHGPRLATPADDRDTVSDMMAVAQAKGWQQVSLKGTESFRRAAWIEANLAGIKTRGFEPKEQDRAMLDTARRERDALTISAGRPASQPAAAAVAAEAPPTVLKAETQTPPGAATLLEKVPASPAKLGPSPTPENVSVPAILPRPDVLVAHGKAPYQNNPENAPSYFVTVQESAGTEKTVWGVDLERAISESNVQVGEGLSVENLGAREVMVQAAVKNDEGKTIGFEEKLTRRNVWEITREAIGQGPETPAKDASEAMNVEELRAQVEKAIAGQPDNVKRAVMDRLAERLQAGLEVQAAHIHSGAKPEQLQPSIEARITTVDAERVARDTITHAAIKREVPQPSVAKHASPSPMP